MMMKSCRVFLIIFFVCFCGSVIAQDQEITINGYRGLEIDSSSADDVVKLLGKPGKIKENVPFLAPPRIEKWLNISPTDKKFKKLAYAEMSPFRNVDFYFLDDKLVVINARFNDAQSYRAKVLAPDDMEAYFGTKFKSYFTRIHKHFPATVKDFLEYSPPPYNKRDFRGTYYNMTSVTEKTFIVTWVNSINGFLAPSIYKGHKKNEESIFEPHFGGYVSDLQIISRTLEKK